MSKVVNLRSNYAHKNVNTSEKFYKKFLNNFPELTLGSFLISLICTFLIVMMTFTIIPVGFFSIDLIKDLSTYVFDPNTLVLALYSQVYSPQIPVILFIGALLGPRLGTFSVTLFVIMGLLGFPFFADGGGLMYIFKPTFGFIAAFIPAAYLVGKIYDNKLRSFKIILAALVGVFLIHITGILYLSINLFSSGYDIGNVKNIIMNLSIENMPYDIILGCLLCSLARPVRGLLWFVMA